VFQPSAASIGEFGGQTLDLGVAPAVADFANQAFGLFILRAGLAPHAVEDGDGAEAEVIIREMQHSVDAWDSH
jgi:hypothetical protein